MVRNARNMQPDTLVADHISHTACMLRTRHLAYTLSSGGSDWQEETRCWQSTRPEARPPDVLRYVLAASWTQDGADSSIAGTCLLPSGRVLSMLALSVPEALNHRTCLVMCLHYSVSARGHLLQLSRPPASISRFQSCSVSSCSSCHVFARCVGRPTSTRVTRWSLLPGPVQSEDTGQT
jgi:hypothetical protein